MERSVIENGRRVARKNFFVFLGGIIMQSSAHYALNNLQSSLNVEAGLGATSLSAQYASMLFCFLFVVPVVVKFLNTKKCLLVADIAFTAFAVANFYPSYFTLVPANILTGFGKSLFWICSGEYIAYFAGVFDYYGSKELDTYRGKVNGYYFAGFMSCQIFGNMITYLVFVLSGGGDPSDPVTSSGYSGEQDVSPLPCVYCDTTSVHQANYTFSISEVCGAKDCQDPNISRADAGQYALPNQITFYLMMSVFLIMHVVGFVMHCFIVDIDGVEQPETEEKKMPGTVNIAYIEDYKDDMNNNSFKDGKDDMNNNCVKDGKDDMNNNCVKDGKDDMNNNCVKDGKNNPIYDDEFDDVDYSEDTISETSTGKDEEQVSQMKEKILEAGYEILMNLKHFKKPFQIIMIPIMIHTGLNLAFVASEITRAYVACVFSVTEVGLAMVFYGTSSFISSFLVGKMCVRWGRKIVSCIGLVLNCAAFTFCLGWIPSEDSSEWVAFALMFMFGLVDGIWQVMASIFSTTVFPNDIKKTFTCWTFWTSVGCLIQFSWSTALCVEYKLYVMYGTLLLGFITHMIAEFKFDGLGAKELTESNV